MSKIYLVMEATSEYNDEYYSLLDSGKNINAFNEKQKAEEKVTLLNINFIRKIRFGEYRISITTNLIKALYEILSKNEQTKNITLSHAKDWTFWTDFSIPENCTDDQVMDIINALDFRAYYIEEAIIS